MTLALPEDLVVDEDVDVLGHSRIGRPSLGVYADRPDAHDPRPDLLEHPLHPRARHQHLADRPLTGQSGIVARMAVDRRPEQDRRARRDARQDMRLAEHAGELVAVRGDMAEIVDPVAGADTVEARHEIEEGAQRAPRLLGPAHQAPDPSPRIMVERQPPVGIGLLVEEIQGGLPGRRVTVTRGGGHGDGKGQDDPFGARWKGRGNERAGPTVEWRVPAPASITARPGSGDRLAWEPPRDGRATRGRADSRT